MTYIYNLLSMSKLTFFICEVYYIIEKSDHKALIIMK